MWRPLPRHWAWCLGRELTSCRGIMSVRHLDMCRKLVIFRLDLESDGMYVLTDCWPLVVQGFCTLIKPGSLQGRSLPSPWRHGQGCNSLKGEGRWSTEVWVKSSELCPQSRWFRLKAKYTVRSSYRSLWVESPGIPIGDVTVPVVVNWAFPFTYI